MKKILAILIIFLITTAVVLFFPRSVEHGVVLGKSGGYISLIANNKVRTFKSDSSFPKLTVVNFKYNILKAFSFKEVNPNSERIMIKDESSFDLESSGKTKLSKDSYYYSVDKDNNITATDSKAVIVGKTNVKSYKSKNGELKTFLVFPLDYSYMRIGITNNNFQSIFQGKSQIKCNTPARLYSMRENLSMDIPEKSIIIVEPEGTNLRLTVNNKTNLFKNRIYIKGDNLTVQTIKRGSPANFNPSYSGVLEFNMLEGGMYIVNEVAMEDYLKKVVPSEMPPSGGLESLKCQAVAARTYAISDMISNRYAYRGFYVDDSTRSQVYNNTTALPLTNQAVDETKGLIMSYEGAPIDAKYYSTSAGTGADYKDVWFFADGSADNRPYIVNNNYTNPQIELPKSEDNWLKFYKDTTIKAVDSDYPYYRWSVEYTSAGLANALNKTLSSLYSSETGRKYMNIYQNSKKLKNLPELTELKDVKVIQRGSTGIVIEIVFIFSNAEVYVRSDSYIRGCIKISSDYTNENTTLVRHKGNPLTNSGSLPSSFFSVEKHDDKFILYGGGYGHGAGMSQYGAIELSKKGLKFDQILNYFYKGINLENLY